MDLLIDKGKYYSVVINDVERAQSDIAYVEKWTDDAGQQMASGTNGIDKDILGNVYADAHASNQGASAGAISGDIDLGVSGTPRVVDKTNILEVIVDCGTVLGEQNVPKENLWLVLPEAFCGMIMKSDLKDASLAGDGTSIMRNGRLGMIGRFTIYASNNLATTTDTGATVFNILAGHPSGLTFASQLTNNRVIPNPDDFGDIMEGLQVYGYKVIKSEAIVWLYAKKG